MSSSRPLASDHGKGRALCHGDDSSVLPEDDSFFETPPDVIFLPASQLLPTSPQPDRTAGCSKHVPEMVSQLQCTTATGEGLPSPVTVGASPVIPIDVDAKDVSTPRGGPGGGKKKDKKLATRNKAAKRRNHPPILASHSTSSRETGSETQPVGEGEESVVSPKATPTPTKRGEGGVEPTSSTSAPVADKAGMPSSSVTPPPPRRSRGGAQGPSSNEQRDDSGPAPFSSQNRRDADWPQQHPIPENLEELVRLYASRRQRLGNQNVSDVLASKHTCLSR